MEEREVVRQMPPTVLAVLAVRFLRVPEIWNQVRDPNLFSLIWHLKLSLLYEDPKAIEFLDK